MTLTFEDDDGNEITVELSTHKERCGYCEGKGKRWPHNLYFTASDLEEDPECLDDLSAYDVRCDECKGTGEIEVPNEDDPYYSEWVKKEEEDAAFRREQEAERRMGA